MKRLAVILPYNEQHIENFTEHFKATIKESTDFYYKLVFLKQKSNRPLNKGKLFNIGYALHKDKFDYFCFHDSDLIPISEECNYSFEGKPISLVGMRNKINFGDQSEVQNFDKYSLPYDEYFGGATLFSKKDFHEVNGYSNEYWGVGYEDYDLLLRCVVKGLPIRTEAEIQVSKTYGTFNGRNSYLEIPAENAKIKKTTNKNFSMVGWFCPNGEPPYGADVDNNRCEYSIFMRPGFHSGLSYIHGGVLKGVIWIRPYGSTDREPVVLQTPLRTNQWYHVGLVVDNTQQTMTLYVNGKEAGKTSYEGELIDYLNRPYYVGVGDPNLSVWRNFYNGQISEVGLWSDALQDYDMELIFEKGIINNKGEYTTSKLPVGAWDFKGGYDNITFDISGNGNHAKFYNLGFANKPLKNNTERYLPYRRNGAYGYLSSEEQFLNLQNLMRSEHPEIMTNRNTFNKKVRNQMQDVDKDGLSSTRFRIVNRQDYQGKHEIIEVVI
tara:strand:- start:22 stop:1503 length:1482 start_codon:yes stop_codon:yes gene_type:complete